MKKKTNIKLTDETCYRMSNSKVGITENKVTANDMVNDAGKSLVQNSLSSNSKFDTLPKIKCEEDKNFTNDSNCDDGRVPSPITLGPGAEIKGKLCHPLPCIKKLEVNPTSPNEDSSSSGICGGILTFFQEGRPLLELSHRSDQRSWTQVKSKTYWPPPSTTTATTTQHPLRHDTPTTHSASDDCSSINSSPWASDHIRKQVAPKYKNVHAPPGSLFFMHVSSFVRSVRKKVRLRRNPYQTLLLPSVNGDDLTTISRNGQSQSKSKKNTKGKLEEKVKELSVKLGWKLESNLNIRSLYEKTNSNCVDATDPIFLSPRKRFLRSLESDVDSHIRKKVHAGLSASHVKNCDRPSSSSPHHKSAISSYNSSSYSIDSLLSSESDTKKNDSYLRTLLKPESKSSRASHGRVRGSLSDYNHIKTEKESMPYSRERRDNSAEPRKPIPDRFDANADISRYTSSQGIGGIYLNPYFDPRYLMLQSLSGGNPLLPQQNDVAVALAAAAAASNPLNQLHISALTASSMIPAGLPAPYAPNTSLASQLLQSPSCNRSSPISLPHSPISKPTISQPHAPVSPHLRILGSPIQPQWTSVTSSPNKIQTEPPDSPPPQDFPLNLSKPKERS